MTVHRFTVNVPNAGTKKASVVLRLEVARGTGALKNFGAAASVRQLKVVHAGITRDSCAKRGVEEIKLMLDPRSSTDVHVLVETAPTGKPSAVVFNLIDNRGGKDVGGAMLACVEPSLLEQPGAVILPRRPCPVTMAQGPYAVLAGGDPSHRAAAASLAGVSELELVAPITNRTAKPLHDVQVYVEHIGASDTAFTPGTWSVGTLNPDDVFYATWRMHIAPGTEVLRASIVAVSQKTDPVRLQGVIHLRERGTKLARGKVRRA